MGNTVSEESDQLCHPPRYAYAQSDLTIQNQTHYPFPVKRLDFQVLRPSLTSMLFVYLTH